MTRVEEPPVGGPRRSTRTRSRGTRPVLPKQVSVPLGMLRQEGVREVGRVSGSSTLFVYTARRVFLLHVSSLPERPIDAYLLQRIADLQDAGVGVSRVAGLLGISEERIALALADAGYRRESRVTQGGGHGMRRGRRISRVTG